ncbi:MAG: tRNA (adenosine(37)-N6)-threonylcarbamoyltransferase complex ATPase subunit type 1 TsaE [Clostridia bacterium]|nr:tRNA (adenosine(37)-N6)-threonylcarbamoyltransferase complex ATPase subunit type 1 TsaE [Clostridia bacterium]
MEIKITARSAEETEAFGRLLAQKLEEAGVTRAFIALLGEMGVGKTAFTRGFASHFGINNIKSPTYTVLNEHRGRVNIHHFDFYRITDGDDLYSIGYDDVIESEGYCIGEWSENILDFLPPEHITVRISRVGFGEADTERLIEADLSGIVEW